MARILIADDDQAVRDLATRALRSDGHTVTVASDGSEAARALASASFDLVISDVEMPGSGGIELVQDFGKPGGPRFLLISGFVEKLTRLDAPAGASVATLAKPFTLEQLRAEVRRRLA